MNLIDSHDTTRALTVCGRDKRRFMQMLAFQFGYPGAPMIYYGDEAGLEGDYAESARRAYPWGNEDAEILSFYRRVLAYRHQSKALTVGTTETLIIDDAQHVYVFARRFERSRFMLHSMPVIILQRWQSVCGRMKTASGMTRWASNLTLRPQRAH